MAPKPAGIEKVEAPPERSRTTATRQEVEEVVAYLVANPKQWFKVATLEKRSTASARARMFREYDNIEAEVHGVDVYAQAK